MSNFANINQEILDARVKASVISLAKLYVTLSFYKNVLKSSAALQEISATNGGELTRVLPRIFSLVLNDILKFDATSNDLGFDVDKLQEYLNYSKVNSFTMIKTSYDQMNQLANDAKQETDKDKRDQLISEYNDVIRLFNEQTAELFRMTSLKNLFEAAFPIALIAGMTGTVPYYTALTLDQSDITLVQELFDMNEQSIMTAISAIENDMAEVHYSALPEITEHTTSQIFIPSVSVISAMLQQYFSLVKNNSATPVAFY